MMEVFWTADEGKLTEKSTANRQHVDMTVGFLYGAGAETLLFVTGTSGKKLSPDRKTKVSGASPENQEKMCLGIRC